jgi:hypothetical protein
MSVNSLHFGPLTQENIDWNKNSIEQGKSGVSVKPTENGLNIFKAGKAIDVITEKLTNMFIESTGAKAEKKFNDKEAQNIVTNLSRLGERMNANQKEQIQACIQIIKTIYPNISEPKAPKGEEKKRLAEQSMEFLKKPEQKLREPIKLPALSGTEKTMESLKKSDKQPVSVGSKLPLQSTQPNIEKKKEFPPKPAMKPVQPFIKSTKEEQKVPSKSTKEEQKEPSKKSIRPDTTTQWGKQERETLKEIQAVAVTKDMKDALDLVTQKKWHQAIDKFNQFLKGRPNNSQALRGRAEAFTQTQQYEKALQDLNKVIEFESSSLQMQQMLGEAELAKPELTLATLAKASITLLQVKDQFRTIGEADSTQLNQIKKTLKSALKALDYALILTEDAKARCLILARRGETYAYQAFIEQTPSKKLILLSNSQADLGQAETLNARLFEVSVQDEVEIAKANEKEGIPVASLKEEQKQHKLVLEENAEADWLQMSNALASTRNFVNGLIEEAIQARYKK